MQKLMSETLAEIPIQQKAILVSQCATKKHIFFFFQAEDGIRDYKVTGVQTCALPIFDVEEYVRAVGELAHGTDVFLDVNVVLEGRVVLGDRVRVGAGCVIRDSEIGEIGRASCRERV